jgi:ankyrin repeat protein
MASRACEFQQVSDILGRGDPAELEALRRLIDGFPHGVDPFLGRPWITDAVAADPLPTVLWMIEAGVELNRPDPEGYPLIHRCLMREGDDRHAVLAALIAGGADVNARGVNDWTPLHMAANEQDLRALEMLLAAGADPSLRTRIDEHATPEEEARNHGFTASADLIAAWPRRS